MDGLLDNWLKVERGFFAVFGGATKYKAWAEMPPSPLRKGRGIEGEGKWHGNGDGSRMVF